MKLIVKTVSVILIACFIFALAIPFSAASLQEQSWLFHLRPTNMAKTSGKESYPAELTVKVAQLKSVTLKGTCSLEGKLTDEDILDAIKQAASKVDGYKSPENAVTDKLKIAELQGKLSFTEEEQARIVKNWLSLVGMDKVADILKGEFPSYGETDAVGVVVGMITSGKLPDAKSLIPFPTDVSGFTQGLVINGVFISIDQYKRDQEKYQNIVELSNARARFREFNAHLNTIIKNKTREKTAWTIRIQDQVVENQLYRSAPDVTVPYIYTSDIVLVKNDGIYENPIGTYQGDFVIDIDLSLEDHDRNFHNYLAKYFNDELKKKMGVVAPSNLFYGLSQSVNRPSENKTTLEGKNVYVTLSDSLGGIFEMNLNVFSLDVKKSVVLHDMVSVIQQKTSGATTTMTVTIITDSEAGTDYRQDYNRVVDINGNVMESTNTDDTAYPSIDVRSYTELTLVIDMMDK